MGTANSFASLSAFREAVAGYRRKSTWLLVGMLLLFIALMAALLLLAEILDRTNESPDSPLRTALMIGLFVPCFAGVFALIWLLERLSPKCPHCSRTIQLGVADHQIIVTRRCPKCAAPLFGEESEHVESSHRSAHELISRETLIADQKLKGFAPRMPLIAWLISGILLTAAGNLLDPWAQSVLAAQIAEVWLPFVRPMMLLPGLMVCGWGLLSYVSQTERRLRRQSCPHCASEISTRSLALNTGNCDGCGLPAVADPVPGMEPRLASPLAPQWSINEFRERAKYRHDRLWIGCLIGGAINLVWFLPVIQWCTSQPNGEVAGTAGAALLLGAIVAITAGQLSGVWWWLRISTRGLHCTECHGELVSSYRLVISSHRCYHCGCTVLQEPTESVT